MTQSRKRKFVLPLLAGSSLTLPGARSGGGPRPGPGPAASGTGAASPAPAPDKDTIRQTKLDDGDCKLLRSNPDEASFYEYDCPGEGGYSLRFTKADLREDIAVIAPDGAAHKLGLVGLAGGGFSELDDDVEWHGEMVEGAFRPAFFLLEQEVAEGVDGRNEKDYGIVVRLEGKPCVVARVDPGPDLTLRTRAAMSGAGECLKGP